MKKTAQTADLKDTLAELENAFQEWQTVQPQKEHHPPTENNPAKKRAKELLNKLKSQIDELS